MRKLYETDYSDIFDNFEDAINSVREYITWDELAVELKNRIPYRTLLDFVCVHCKQFWTEFESEIADAERAVAEQYVTELDSPKTEEEEQSSSLYLC